MAKRAVTEITLTYSAGSSPQAAAEGVNQLSGGHADWRKRLAALLPKTTWNTRFTPAPTGYLHLGHLVNAIYVWGIARAYGGRVILRMEDHDRSRCRCEYEQALLDDLDWLGFVPDEATTTSYRDCSGVADGVLHPFRQSQNEMRYRNALAKLEECNLVYSCTCSRRDIEERQEEKSRLPVSTAEHLETLPEADAELRYTGYCRARSVPASSTKARRVVLTEKPQVFDDLRLGAQRHVPSLESGDLLARDRDGNWTYQFAVTVDDMVQNVEVIIRGEDLLASTGRQLQLSALLGRQDSPQFLHHTLVRRSDGAKLSKAASDTSLRERREQGAKPEGLIGEAAFAAGLTPDASELPVSDLARLFLPGS